MRASDSVKAFGIVLLFLLAVCGLAVLAVISDQAHADAPSDGLIENIEGRYLDIRLIDGSCVRLDRTLGTAGTQYAQIGTLRAWRIACPK